MTNRIPTWQKVGKAVSNQHDVQAALEEVGLDFDLRTVPFKIEGYNMEAKTKALISINREGTAQFISAVPKDYEAFSPAQMMNFLSYIDKDVSLERAGLTSKGRTLWMIGKVQETFKVLDDDIQPYILVESGLGSGKAGRVRVCISTLRMICQNQFNAAFSEAPNVVNINHWSDDVDKIIAEAENVLLSVDEYKRAYTAKAEEMIKMKVSKPFVETLAREISGIKLGDDYSERKERRMRQFLTAYDADDNQNLKETAWGLMNAYSDYTTHLQPLNSNTDKWDESQFTAITRNNAKQTHMLKAIESEHKCPICGTEHN